MAGLRHHRMIGHARVPPWLRGLGKTTHVTAVAGWAAAAIATLALIGWALNITALKSVGTGQVEMKANTAVGFLLFGGALLLLRDADRQGRVRAARWLALGAALIGALTSFEYIGWDLGIDQLLVSDGAAAFPGRPAPHTAATFLALGMAMVLHDRHRRASQTALAGAGVLVLLAICGSAYGVQYLSGVSAGTAMALPTLVALILVLLGFMAARPRDWPLSVLCGATSGGALARLVVAPAVICPLGLGLVPIALVRADVIGYEIGQSLYAASTVALLVVLLTPAAQWLDRVDRRLLEEEGFKRDRFQSLLDGAPDAMVVADQAGEIVFVNEQALRSFGFGRDELIGQPVELLVPDQLKGAHPGHRREFMREPRSRPMGADVDLLARRRDGTQFPVEISLSPLETADGMLVTAAIRDVTERAVGQAERAGLAAIVDSSGDAIARLTTDGVIETWNDSSQTLYGYSADEAVGQRAAMLLARDVAERDATLASVLAGGEPARIEREDVRKDGSSVDVAVTDSPIRNAHGDVIGISRVARDITDRKRDERKLAEAARFFELSSDMVCTASYDGFYQQINDRWQETLGWTIDELRSRPSVEFVHDDDVDATVGKTLRRGGAETVRCVNRHATKDGGWRWLEWLAVSVPEEQLIYASARDITVRVEAEAAMQAAERAAAAALDTALDASRSKSAFLANMSHEIRTPLNGVIGMADLLLDSPLSAEQHENAMLLKRSGETLVSVVGDILDFSKIEAGALQLESVDFDLVEVVEDACDLLSEVAHEKGVAVTMHLDPDLPDIVRGDSNRVRQVVTNLLSNAVKFTSDGEIRVTLKAVGSGDTLPHVRFEVTDTGIGIEPDRIEQLFEPFLQADDSTTRRFGGTGLGLAIVKQLVEMMGGEVQASSLPGHGSNFWFTLPFERGHVPRDGAQPVSTLADIRLLVVDDNATNRRLVEQVARRWDMRVTAVSSASEAMDLLREAAARSEPFDCAALDMHMPGTDGLQLARAIWCDASIPTPALVMLTSTYDDRRLVRDAGIDVHMTKPVRRTRLHNALLEALGIQTQRDQRPREPDGAGAASSPLILVAEDNEVNQILAVRMLERRGYRSEVVTDGRQAVEALEAGSFDAVLMDCQMPGLSGYDATRELRGRERGHDRTPVIAMTANTLLGDREDCLASGMDDYIAKPLKPEELDRVLQRWAPRLITASPRRSPSPDVPAPEEPPLAQRTLDPAVVERLHAEVGAACFASLVGLFGTQQPGTLAEVHEAIERGDAQAVREKAHKLAGGCAAMGVTDMTALCRQLEARARSGSLDGAAALADDIDETFESAHAALLGHVALLAHLP